MRSKWVMPMIPVRGPFVQHRHRLSEPGATRDRYIYTYMHAFRSLREYIKMAEHAVSPRV
jgi:hypothetical protein